MPTPVKKVAKRSSVNLKLTAKQIDQIRNAFGPEFADRLKSVKVEQIAGFLASNMLVN